MKMEKNDGLVFLMDDQLATSGRSPAEIWEGQLKTEIIALPSDLRPAVKQYIETIIAATRIGSLKPNEYAAQIIAENQGSSATWRFLSESAARVHDRMTEEAKGKNDETAQKIATALSANFLEVIYSTGFRHEGEMGRSMEYLLDKLRRFPQPTQPSGNIPVGVNNQ